MTFASGQTAVSSTNVTFIDAPTLASVTPASGPLAGGTSVTLAGQQLAVLGTPVVTLNGVPCAIVSSTDSIITVRFRGLCLRAQAVLTVGTRLRGLFSDDSARRAALPLGAALLCSPMDRTPLSPAKPLHTSP